MGKRKGKLNHPNSNPKASMLQDTFSAKARSTASIPIDHGHQDKAKLGRTESRLPEDPRTAQSS